MPGRSIVFGCPALVFFVMLLDAVVAPSRALEPGIARVDSLWRAGARDSAAVLTRSLATAAHASGDTAVAIDLLTRAGQQARFFGKPIEAERDLREAMLLAAAIDDPQRDVAALRWLSLVVAMQGRSDESRRLSDSLLLRARAIGDVRHEGWAHVSLAWFALQDGRTDDAVASYRTATACFAQCEDREGEVWALSGLGRVLTARGEPLAAASAYRRAVEHARALGDPIGEANALNDLASIEYMLGDPGQALSVFERALAIHRRSGSTSETILPMINIALCLSALERYAQAESVLAAGLTICHEHGYRDLAVTVGIHAANLCERRGFARESARQYRRILAEEGRLSLRNRIKALLGVGTALAAADSVAESLGYFEEAASLLSRDVAGDVESRIYISMGEALLRTGRPGEALAATQVGLQAAQRFGQLPGRVEALALAGRTCRALGRTAEARAFFLGAAAAWEEQRGVPLDPVWREQRGTIGKEVYADLAAVLLDQGHDGGDASSDGNEPAAREAFDRLQTFKARTLLERILGPGEPSPGAAGFERTAMTLRALQEDILRPGELFLDYYLGAGGSFLFAVTREDLRVVRLPASEGLERKGRGYFDLVSAPPRSRRERYDPRALDGAARGLADLLLGDVEPLIRSSRTVFVSADGLLALLPFEEMIGRLTARQAGAPDPIATEWIRIPSASVLAELRRARPPAAPASGSSILVLQGEGTPGGAPLRGTREEANLLRRRFHDVEIRTDGPSSDSGSILSADAQIIHVAAHLHVDDANPWRSEIRLGPRGSPSNLTASRIATAELRSRLAVLSSCSSAAGRVVTGEGVIGVTSAFLSAGVPAVVATLWPVDDRTTAALMEEFYRRLGQGESAAAALAGARETFRARPETAAPFYWAGFVLIGEGDAVVNLRQRAIVGRLPGGALTLAVAAVLLTAGAAMLAWRRLRPA